MPPCFFCNVSSSCVCVRARVCARVCVYVLVLCPSPPSPLPPHSFMFQSYRTSLNVTCITPQYTATLCTTLLQHICNTSHTNKPSDLLHLDMSCTTLQHTATHCTILHQNVPHCHTLQHTATQCSSSPTNQPPALHVSRSM